MRVFVGMTEWNYDEWRGNFYPLAMSRANFLQYYAQVFNTAEIASTYYRLPFYNHVKNWGAKTPDDFCFAIKLIWQTTHQNRMERTEANKMIVDNFFERLKDIDDKIGIVIIQPPSDLEFDEKIAKEFVGLLPKKFRYVIEGKGPSWQGEKFVAFCAENGVIPASVSSSKGEYFPEHPKLKDRFVRLSGKMPDNQYLYTDLELQEYADKIKSSGCENAWIYFSNTAQRYAVENARAMKQLF